MKTAAFIRTKCGARGYSVLSIQELLRLYNQAYHLTKENVSVHDFAPEGEASFEFWLTVEIDVLVDVLAEMQEKNAGNLRKRSLSCHE